MFCKLSRSYLKDLFPVDFLARKKFSDFLSNLQQESNLVSYCKAALHGSLVYFLLWCCQCTCSRTYFSLILAWAKQLLTTKSNLRDKKICLPIPIANMLKINNKECIENRYAGQISKPHNAICLNLLYFCPSIPSFVFIYVLFFCLHSNVICEVQFYPWFKFSP